jgi:hypothetical protein
VRERQVERAREIEKERDRNVEKDSCDMGKKICGDRGLAYSIIR